MLCSCAQIVTVTVAVALGSSGVVVVSQLLCLLLLINILNCTCSVFFSDQLSFVRKSLTPSFSFSLAGSVSVEGDAPASWSHHEILNGHTH